MCSSQVGKADGKRGGPGGKTSVAKKKNWFLIAKKNRRISVEVSSPIPA